MSSLVRRIRHALAQVIDGIGTLIAIMLFLVLVGLFAYGVVGSCTGQFDQRDDVQALSQALHHTPT